MSHPGRLEKKVAIVTGGALGLGEGIVRKFIHEGAKVVIFDINAENGEKVTSSLPGDAAVFIQGDATKEEDWEKALQLALDKFGGLTTVVNNAGVVHNAAVSILVPT